MPTFFLDHQTLLSLGGRWCAHLWCKLIALDPGCIFFLVRDSLDFSPCFNRGYFSCRKKIGRFGGSEPSSEKTIGGF